MTPSSSTYKLPIPTFVTPLTTSLSRSSSAWLAIHKRLPCQHDSLCSVRLARRPRPPSTHAHPVIIAVQARPVSGDSDGEVSENSIATHQKSFSVGLTIVSGFDPALRRSVIERIVSRAEAGRVVVVTTGGIITSTYETNGLKSPSSTSTSSNPQNSSATAATTQSSSAPTSVPSSTQANGASQQQSEQTSTSPRNNNSEQSSLPNTQTSQSNIQNQSSTTEHFTDPPSTNASTSSSNMQNLEGWISCNSCEEMVEVVLKLATSRECDYIIAESPVDGGMEPQQFAQTLHNRGSSSLRVDTLVSVLDGETLLEDLLASPLSTSPPSTAPTTVEPTEAEYNPPPSTANLDNAPASTAGRPTEASDDSQPSSPLHEYESQNRPMILVSLVEHANVVVVAQQPDDRNLEQLTRVQEVVSVLNGNASIVPTIMTPNSSSSTVDNSLAVDLLINTNLYNNEDVEYSATWKRVLRAARMGPPIGTTSVSGNIGAGIGGVAGVAPNGSVTKTSLPRYVKEATFLYKAKRPFHPSRLYEHIKDVATFTGVIRSTGKIWLATRMLAPLEWNQAGVAATLRTGKLFWAATPEVDWPENAEERNRIMSDWDTRYGDRETEIVFVGIGIDKSRLQGLLDGCLLQDEEMVFNNLWENFEDPFVQWVPLIEDEYEEEDMEPPTPQVEVAQVREEVRQVQEEELPVDEEQVSERTGGDPDENLLQVESIEDDPQDVYESKRVDGANNENDDEGSNTIADFFQVEGEIEDNELPDNLYEELSAIDLLEQGLNDTAKDKSKDEDANEVEGKDDDGRKRLIVQTQDEEVEYNEDDAVIASWDGSIADRILTKIPKIGIPITLVTGFLGSGKTTLLNFILTANHGLRIAVLVNEFGEIDIDNQLVQNPTWEGDDVIELSNGCICCDINESFLTAVNRIIERKDEVDYIIVETTGVADPTPVINSLMETDIAQHVRLDGVLTLVDVENFDVKTHMNSQAALAQILKADTLLLSKTDVTSEEKTNEAIEYIRQVRPAARILRSQRGKVPIDFILDVGMRVAESPAHVNPGITDEGDSIQQIEQKCSDDHDHVHEHEHEHEHEHSNHLEVDGFVTTSFKSDRPLDTQLFMDKFLKSLPEGVYRAKGLLYFQGFSERYVFQLSGRRYHMQMDEWPEGDAPGTQLVVIGRDLNIEQLRETLEECHAESQF